MDVRPLQSNVVEHRSKPWIDDSPGQIVRQVGLVPEPEMKANAIFFEGCSREHMNGARKVSLILQRALRPSPQRSLAVLPRLKQVDLLSVGASMLSYCDVLREEDLDGAIRGRMTWQHNPQRRLSVFLYHLELHANAVADAWRRSHLIKCRGHQWLHGEVPEVSDRAGFEPQRNAAMSVCSRFEVFDNQRRLFVVVDVEARLFTAHLDLDLRPRSRHKVDVRFVLARCFFPKPGPGPLRKRDVLSGMIPALLIIGATVCGAQVKRVIGLQILLHAESDADEPTRFPTCSRRHSACNLRL